MFCNDIRVDQKCLRIQTQTEEIEGLLKDQPDKKLKDSIMKRIESIYEETDHIKMIHKWEYIARRVHPLYKTTHLRKTTLMVDEEQELGVITERTIRPGTVIAPLVGKILHQKEINKKSYRPNGKMVNIELNWILDYNPHNSGNYIASFVRNGDQPEGTNCQLMLVEHHRTSYAVIVATKWIYQDEELKINYQKDLDYYDYTRTLILYRELNKECKRDMKSIKQRAAERYAECGQDIECKEIIKMQEMIADSTLAAVVGKSKRGEEEIRSIRESFRQGASISEIAAKYGISKRSAYRKVDITQLKEEDKRNDEGELDIPQLPNKRLQKDLDKRLGIIKDNQIQQISNKWNSETKFAVQQVPSKQITRPLMSEVSKILKEYFDWADFASIRTKLAHLKYKLMLARINENPHDKMAQNLTTVGAAIYKSLTNHEILYLDVMATHFAHQGKGIGKSLVSELQKIGNTKNKDILVWADVNILDLYESMGFYHLNEEEQNKYAKDVNTYYGAKMMMWKCKKNAADIKIETKDGDTVFEDVALEEELEFQRRLAEQTGESQEKESTKRIDATEQFPSAEASTMQTKEEEVVQMKFKGTWKIL